MLQESDWVAKGPHQGHHLLERMRERGHEIRVVDFEIRWSDQKQANRFARRRIFLDVHKVVDKGTISVIRPGFFRLPVLDVVSLVLTHAVEIRRQFREFRPDVVVGFGILNSFLGIWIARAHKVPFVEYVIDELYRLMPRRILRGPSMIVEQADYRRAGLVLSINEALRDYTIGMGASPDRTRVLPAGVDLSRYRDADRSGVRNRLGLVDDDLLLFYMGWLYPFSGLREVAEDVVSRPADQRSVKLLAVGKGELWDSLAKMASANNATRRLFLERWRPYAELPGLLAAADICILPAHRVGLMENIVPIKMYEYMAAAKPVIATRLPGLFREFSEGHGVVYVDSPREVVPLATALAETEEILHLGSLARDFVSRNDWRKVTDEFERLLRELVEPETT
ncbi:MAG TPA: glycosyltransferase [Thermoplasmata archaeon]|nr:glycosyltransferase [Thermoplasmata archaeon]